MKKSVFLLILPLVLCSCTSREALDETAFVKTIGIDSGIISAEIEKSPPGKEEASSVAEGLYEIDAKTDKAVSYGQTDVILLGEEYARKGIKDTLEYFLKNNQFRLDMPIVTVRGNANEIIVQNEKVSEKIKELFRADKNMTVSKPVTIAEFIKALEDPRTDAKMPYIEQNDGEIKICGYCGFNDDRLAFFASEEISMGINIIEGNEIKGILQFDGFVAQIENNSSNVTLDGDKINIKTQMNMKIISSENKSSEEMIASASEKINSLICETVIYLRNNNCDCASLGKATGEKDNVFDRTLQTESTVKISKEDTIGGKL